MGELGLMFWRRIAHILIWQIPSSDKCPTDWWFQSICWGNFSVDTTHWLRNYRNAHQVWNANCSQNIHDANRHQRFSFSRQINPHKMCVRVSWSSSVFFLVCLNCVLIYGFTFRTKQGNKNWGAHTLLIRRRTIDFDHRLAHRTGASNMGMTCTKNSG
jgi:hypothetical protein